MIFERASGMLRGIKQVNLVDSFYDKGNKSIIRADK